MRDGGEDEKMKKKVMILTGVLILVLLVWMIRRPTEEPRPEPYTMGIRTVRPNNFEGAIAQNSTTHIVIAQYVGRRDFGRYLIEFEFEVSDVVFGTEVAETIFVYASIELMADVGSIEYRPGDLELEQGVDYLLPLSVMNHPQSIIHEDGFMFRLNIVVDLGHPVNSNMYSEPLAHHALGLDFNDPSLTREAIIEYVEYLVQDKPITPDIIRSADMRDIIRESPYVWVIEINEVERLAGDIPPSDWLASDIYHAEIVEVLKGNGEVGYQFMMVFDVDAVFTGEHHIVATYSPPEARSFYRYSSRNSLFSMDELDVIVEMIESSD